MSSYLCVPTESQPAEHHFRKPKSSRLHLDINDSPSNIAEAPCPIVVKSAQHSRSKKFVFPTIDRSREIITALQRLHVLQTEKRELLKELRSFREGALSAIIEKQETIEHLREKIEEAESSHSEDNEDIARNESYATTRLLHAGQLMEELRHEREEISKEHIQEIVHKDHLIVELGEELERVKQDISVLEIRDRALTQKIHQVEEETEQLQDELLRSKSSLSELRDSLKGSTVLNSSFVKSLKSSPERKISASLHLLKTEESKQHDPHELSYQQQTIDRLRQINEEQKDRHRRQLEQLRKYYQEMLAATAVKRGLSIATQQNDESGSEARSLRSYRQSDCCSERIEAGILKNEIQMLVEPSIPNLFTFDQNNPEKRIPTAGSIDECESQFSYKHFQYDLPRFTVTDNSTTVSKLRTDNNLSINEAIKLANHSTHSRHSRSSSAALLNNGTSHSRHPVKVAQPEDVLNRPGVRYGIFAGGMLLSIGVLYAVYRNRG